MTKVGLALRLPIRGLVKNTIFKQFCGGETIAACMETATELDKFHIGTILDYSVEGQEKEHPLDMTASEILATIRAAQVNPNIPFCVFKTSGIASNRVLYKVSEGMNLSPTEQGHLERIEARIEQICSAAELADTPIFIDAEESWIQPAIDRFAKNMMERHNTQKPIVYNTIQLYRKDRLDFLKKSYEEAVAGGYFLGEKTGPRCLHGERTRTGRRDRLSLSHPRNQRRHRPRFRCCARFLYGTPRSHFDLCRYAQ